jgi:hypothetical protein
LNIDIKGRISFSTDNDYFKFTIPVSTLGAPYSITLQTLPGDYDIRLFNSNQQQIGISQKYNKENEKITVSLVEEGPYFVRVYGWRGANSATQCYTLKVFIDNNATRETSNEGITTKGGKLSIYPSVAKENINLVISNFATRADISIYNLEGKLLLRSQATQANSSLNINGLSSGVYVVKVKDSDGIEYQSRFVKL